MRRVIWACVAAMCLGAASIGWFLGRLEMRYDAAMSGTATAARRADSDVTGDVTFLDIPDGFMWLSSASVATRGDSLWLVDARGIVGPITFLDMTPPVKADAAPDSIWIRTWTDDLATPRADRFGPDRVFATAWGDSAFVPGYYYEVRTDMPPGTCWVSNLSVVIRGDSLHILCDDGTLVPIVLLDMAPIARQINWSENVLVVSDTTTPVLDLAHAPPETMKPWAHTDTLYFAEADGKRDIVLYVDGARMINTGDLEPLYLHATLEGRLYWAKGEWVFKGTP